MESGSTKCPYCAEIIKAEAVKCRYCGEYLNEELRLQRLEEGDERIDYRFSPGLAAVLSIIGTGFGQLYQMRVLAAVGFMAAMLFFMVLGALGSQVFFIAAAIVHFTNIFEAYLWRPGSGDLIEEEYKRLDQSQAAG